MMIMAGYYSNKLFFLNEEYCNICLFLLQSHICITPAKTKINLNRDFLNKALSLLHENVHLICVASYEYALLRFLQR